jgi:hypothetical protein
MLLFLLEELQGEVEAPTSTSFFGNIHDLD